jgi:class 3 adenylate cyclase
MTYTPHPVDTSSIELPESLAELTELLAEHAHDVWARRRIEQGWTYGPQRSDASKESPSLVPYEQLDDAEKQYDRDAALETLRLLSALGYRLVQQPHSAALGKDSVIAQMLTARSDIDSGSDNSNGELGALLDIWSKRRDDETFWRSSPEPYRYLAAQFLKVGAAPLAKEVSRTALAYQVRSSGGDAERPWANDVELCLIFGLSLARTANTAHAQQVLGELHDRLHMGEDRPLDDSEKHVWQETLGMLGRTYKDQSEQVTDLAAKQQLRQKSLEMYERAYRLSGGYWTGINVATLALLNGDTSRADQVAREVRAKCLAAPPTPRDRYWIPATLGEAALVLGDLQDASNFYQQAYRATQKDFGNLHATRRHARWLLEHHGQDVSQLEVWLPIPKVVVFAGQMIDRPGQSPGRFPARLAEPIKAAIKAWLQRHHALVGFSSAACGSEILFLEAMRELGGECRVVLPFHENQFAVASVDIIPGTNWNDRFADVLKNAVQVVRASRAPLQSGSVAYAFANQVLHGLAVRRAAELDTPLLGLAIWNNEDSEESTAAMATRWHEHGVPVFGLDVAKLLGAGNAEVSVVQAKPPLKAPVSWHGQTGKSASQQQHGDCRVTALLFADAVGFSNLPDAEAPLFVHEFMGRIAALLDEYEILPPSTPNSLWSGLAEQQTPDPESARTGALRPHVTVRETWGDGLFLAFPSLHDAGEFALRLTAMVRDTNWTDLGFSQPLSLRIALHAGPVYPGTDPITHMPKAIGSHISAAARLEPRTPPGEIYASEAFAALLALGDEQSFTCEYVEQLEWGKHYGTFPTYVVRRRFS